MIRTWPIYLLLIVAFVLYFFFQTTPTLAVIFGAIVFFSVIILFIIEITNGVKEEGYVKNAIEIVIAIVLVVALWYSLKFLLKSEYPLNVVPSCSMLPYLQRGDMILLQGSNASGIKAPVVSVSASALNSNFSSVNTEALQCIAYNVTGNRVSISQLIKPGYSVGLYKQNTTGGYLVSAIQQNKSLIKYQCGIANIKFQNGTTGREAYTTAISVNNVTVRGDKNNSIVVYQTIPQDLFNREGDSYIVHRVYAILNASGKFYYLTKGDNNPGLDIQYYNYPANQSQIGGKVIADIPYLGYLKLILSNNFVEPTGCNYTVQN